MNIKSNQFNSKYDHAILEVRTEINILDEKIVELLKQRHQLVLQAEEIKVVDELPQISHEREQVVLENVLFGLAGSQKTYVQKVYQQILSSSREVGTPLQ